MLTSFAVPPKNEYNRQYLFNILRPPSEIHPVNGHNSPYFSHVEYLDIIYVLLVFFYSVTDEWDYADEKGGAVSDQCKLRLSKKVLYCKKRVWLKHDWSKHPLISALLSAPLNTCFRLKLVKVCHLCLQTSIAASCSVCDGKNTEESVLMKWRSHMLTNVERRGKVFLLIN